MTARHPHAARRAGLPSAVRLLQSVALSAAMFWFPATRAGVPAGGQPPAMSWLELATVAAVTR